MSSKSHDRKGIKWMLLIYFVLSCTGVLAKYNAISSEPFSLRFFMILGLQILGLMVFTFCWQSILRKYQLSFAYAFKGTITIWALVFGRIIFNENITMNNIIGSIFIIVGIGVISYE